jgi:DNA repair protein RAD57
VLVLPPQDLARKLQVADAQDIIDAISHAIASPPVVIDSSYTSTSESISTGDDAFDALLGGGIVTGAIWEVVGER